MALPYDVSISGARTLNAAVVSTRPTWGDSWTSFAYSIQCVSVTRAVAPNMSQATLLWHYGLIKEYFEADFTAWLKNVGFDLGYYVRIVLTSDSDDDPQPVTWYGVIVDIADEQHGTKNGVEQGTQRITCYGLEYLWTRQMVMKSIVAIDASVTDTNEIQRAIIFNGGKGDRLEADDQHRANKAAGVPVFASEVNATDAELWTAKDILTYLTDWFYPDAFGAVTTDFSACGDLDWYTPTIDAEGRSVWEVLSMICDRRRGLGWFLSIEDDDPVFHFFSYAETDITLPSGKTLGANTRLFTLDYDSAVDAAAVVVEQSAANRYSQVIARGARRTSTFSLTKADGTLLDDWSSTMETSYDTGASGVGALEVWEQIYRSDNYRQSEALKRVYSWFRMNTDREAYGGIPAFPTIDPTSGVVQTTVHENAWYPGLRFLSHLMLKSNVDSSSGLPGSDNNPTDAQAEWLRPFGVIKCDGTRYMLIDKIGRAGANSEELGDDGGGLDCTCSLRMQDSAPGVVVNVHGAQHKIALNHFSATNTEDQPQLDYDTIIFTVSANADSYAEQCYPVAPENFIDNTEILYLDLRDRARLDYLVAGTVVDILDGVLQTALGGWIRDDREYLKDIARAAWNWYSTPRVSIDLVLRQISAEAEIGDLITEIGSAGHEQTVNSVITQITWNMEQGTTSIQTQFGELDFTGVFA